MLLGLDFFADDESLTPTHNAISEIVRLKVKNAIYDEINIRERVDLLFNTDKTEWQYDNVLLAKFQDNLNAGNVDFVGLSVANLLIKRRKAEEFEWQDLHKFTFDVDAIDYEFYDRYVEANQKYEYAVVPITSGDVEGNFIIADIIPEFEGAFLLDKNNIFKLLYNMEYGVTERVQLNEVFNPIDSKYPIVVSNGDIDYEKGSITALVLSTIEINNNINRHQEKLHRKQLTDFLVNKRPKVLKDGNGNIWLISCVGRPTIDYLNNLGQSLANISFEWVEIADSNDIDSLVANGLV